MKTDPDDSINYVTSKDFSKYVSSGGFDEVVKSRGLTKREYFAGKIISSAMFQVHYEGFGNEECARSAVQLADALIAELNKEVK